MNLGTPSNQSKGGRSAPVYLCYCKGHWRDLSGLAYPAKITKGTAWHGNIEEDPRATHGLVFM
jgi:hypothetical protein